MREGSPTDLGKIVTKWAYFFGDNFRLARLCPGRPQERCDKNTAYTGTGYEHLGNVGCSNLVKEGGVGYVGLGLCARPEEHNIPDEKRQQHRPPERRPQPLWSLAIDTPRLFSRCSRVLFGHYL